MKNRSILLMASLAVACLLAVWPRPATAFIIYTPPTLGNLCRQSTHIYVLRVERVEKAGSEKGSIIFKSVEQLKAQGVVVPDGTLAKHVIASDVHVTKPTGPNGAKVILDWAAEGKRAVLFALAPTPPKKEPGEPAPEIDLKGCPAHVYIDGYWYLATCDSSNSKVWVAINAEPIMLTRYCGAADKLGAAVAKILGGEEVVVPAMVGDNKPDLEARRAKVQDLPASLKIQNYDEHGKPVAEVKGVVGRFPSGKLLPEPAVWRPELDGKKPEPGDKKPDEKKPDSKQPDDKKVPDRKPDRVGTVKALAADGKSFTLLPSPNEKNKEPAPIEIQIREGAKIMDGKEPGKLAVGQIVNVWFGKGSENAAEILIGKLPDPPEKKPVEKKPDDKKPDLVGTVKAFSGDGKRFTLQIAPTEKGKDPVAVDIQLGEDTKITAGKEPGKLAVGQTVSVWLRKGDAKIAVTIQIGTPPEKKPAPPDDKGKKPNPDALEKKPDAPAKPKDPPKPARDPAPTAAVIDAEVEKYLATVKIPASPQADDAEFLRRVTLDLTGRIPTYQQTVTFLDSKDPGKRRKLIDELLDSLEYGEHLATIWRNLLVGRELNLTGKGGGNDTFRPWLAEQFNDNRGWNAIVTDLLTAEGTPRDNPATAFLLANSENSRPQPNKVTGATAALFWGVNLRCAECHSHPFAHWKQTDFWGTAAFFGKVQYGGSKTGPQALAESLTGVPSPKEKGQSAPTVRGAAIVIPATSGKSAGQVVKARFLGKDEPALDEKEPFRPIFAKWATAADNPYFARAAVNRQWAHFFGRGFVHPIDGFDENNLPSHPELLERLAKEFVASDFDLKHLARCITTSKAYQRTYRPVPGNDADIAYSHMSVKVLTPEVLYDALAVVGKTSGNPGKGEKQESRDQFLRSFRIDEEATATDYIQGIPELLRLMNASTPNRGAAVVDKLCSSKASPAEAIETLYLTVLSRRPTTAEAKLMSDYLSRCKDDREGYRGVLWMLLNSSEFALNH